MLICDYCGDEINAIFRNEVSLRFGNTYCDRYCRVMAEGPKSKFRTTLLASLFGFLLIIGFANLSIILILGSLFFMLYSIADYFVDKSLYEEILMANRENKEKKVENL